VYPHDARTVEALIERSDAALYLAKSRGKNNIMSYGELNLTNPS
jgi:predicted signal transduction protein with EAL and GGDEF domain